MAADGDRVSSVDIIAGGRLIFGIGAGGSALSDPAYLTMVRREYDGMTSGSGRRSTG
jgi:hypothetical protein